MKTILTAVCLIGLAGGANAFKLQKVGARELTAAGQEIAAPLPSAASNKYAGSEIADAYGEIERVFYSAVPKPADWEIAGEWEGRVFIRDGKSGWRSLSLNVSFRKTTAAADLGPLFQNYSTELHAAYPYYSSIIEQRLSMHGNMMEFQFRTDKQVTVTFKQFMRGQKRYLSMRTDCYGDNAFGYFYKKSTVYANTTLNEYH